MIKLTFLYSFIAVLIASLFSFPFLSSVAKHSYNVFYLLHTLHVFFSAFATVSVYKIISKKKIKIWKLILIIYISSIIIPTISDSLIPYIAEWLLDMPYRELHIGFLEKGIYVNTVMVLGVLVGYFKPIKYMPHFVHVFVSSLASVFHILMSGQNIRLDIVVYSIILIFLLIAVWVPCALSDIVIPLIFKEKIHKHEI